MGEAGETPGEGRAAPMRVYVCLHVCRGSVGGGEDSLTSVMGCT